MTSTHDRAAASSTLWDRWLATVLVAVIGYGAVLVVRGSAVLPVFDWLGFGPRVAGITADPAVDHVLLIYGVLGAVLLGWMLLLLAVARGPLLRRQRWAWTAMTTCVSAWFVIDSGFSLAIGATEHAMFNLGFAAALGIPLIGLRRHLRPGTLTTLHASVTST